MIGIGSERVNKSGVCATQVFPRCTSEFLLYAYSDCYHLS